MVLRGNPAGSLLVIPKSVATIEVKTARIVKAEKSYFGLVSIAISKPLP